MQTTVRTTVRLRKDLFDQSRLLAFQRNTSLQAVINDTLERGFGHISDLNLQEEAMDKIDEFRESLRGRKINTDKLIEKNKRELEERTNRLLRNLK